MIVARQVFKGQAQHFVLLAVLLLCLVFAEGLPGFANGDLGGLSTQSWFWLVVVNAIVHQVFVWYCWRTELHTRGLTRVFGGAAFPLYATLFSVLILARPVLITVLAISNAGTAALDPLFGKLIALLLAFPVIYLGYSVRRYFGFRRAFGIDHFDPAFRHQEIVRGGIFRYTSNGMYVYGFLLLWIPAFYFSSTAAFVAAAFSHAYIWVHYLVTEKPDMDYIYGH